MLLEGLLFGSAVDPDRKPVGFYREVVTEVVPVVDAIGVVGGGRGQVADLWVGFACERDHFADKGFLEGAAVGEDGAGGGLGCRLEGCGEQVEQSGEEELFHRVNLRNKIIGWVI